MDKSAIGQFGTSSELKACGLLAQITMILETSITTNLAKVALIKILCSSKDTNHKGSDILILR